MKKTHIAIIILIAVGIAAIMSTFTDASTYVSFPLAEKNEGKQFTVIGYLDKEGDMIYTPERNQFTFTAIDKEGNERKVIYFQPKPQDFEKSEEITMKGFATDSAFVAEQILMKCPSKYNETNDVENTYE